jgi:hypothetical protein
MSVDLKVTSRGKHISCYNLRKLRSREHDGDFLLLTQTELEDEIFL